MNLLCKLFALALAGVVTIGDALAIHQAWKALSPFWAGFVTVAGILGLFGWWIVTAFVLDEDWQKEYER